MDKLPPLPPPESLGRRVSVVGTSGSGKSTVARALSARLGLPHVELDALNHEPDWRQADPDVLRARVTAATEGDGWVVDGNYGRTRDLVWPRAEAVVWLDYPLAPVMIQLLRRTLRRLWYREELWNGNRERLSHHLQWDGLIFWALRTHGMYKREYESLLARPEHQHLRVVRLRHPREARRWLAPLETGRVDEPSLQ